MNGISQSELSSNILQYKILMYNKNEKRNKKSKKNEYRRSFFSIFMKVEKFIHNLLSTHNLLFVHN